MAGIDMALWDARARRGLPLVPLLGGRGDDRRLRRLRTMAGPRGGEAEELRGHGFRGVKVKVGGGRPGRGHGGDPRDAQRGRRGRRLMVDYNQSLTVRGDRAGPRARREGLAWIEEPPAPTISRVTPGSPRRSHRRSSSARTGGAARVAKARRAGLGPRHARRDEDRRRPGWLRASALADAAGLPVSSHTFPELSAHLLGSRRPRPTSNTSITPGRSSSTRSRSRTARYGSPDRPAAASSGTRPRSPTRSKAAALRRGGSGGAVPGRRAPAGACRRTRSRPGRRCSSGRRRRARSRGSAPPARS